MALILIIALLLASPASAQDRYGIAWSAGQPTQAALSEMKSSLHVQWLRTDCAWSTVQAAGPTSWDWSSCDGVVNGAVKVGIKPLLMLGYTPAWATVPGCTGNKCEPKNTADYVTFARAAAARYNGKVKAYEIWNEENSPAFWQPTANPAKYTAMLRGAYDAIKAVDPKASVLNGGFAAVYNGNGAISSVEYLKLMYQNGAAGHFDTLAVHPYCYAQGFNCPIDEAAWSEWSKMFWLTTPSANICLAVPCNMRAIMVANGESAKQISATEYGSPSSGYIGASQSVQAKDLHEGYSKFRSYGNLTSTMFWYNGVDSCTNKADPECNFGLVTTTGARKASYTAYQQEALK